MDGECASVVAPLGAMQLFLEEYYAAGIRALLVDADRRVCSLEIDMHELLEFNYELALSVLDSPTRHLGLFNRACVAAQRALLRRSEERYTVKEHAQVRIAHLPNHPALQRSRIPGSRDVGRLLSLTGTAIRTGLVKMMETHRWFLCTQCRGTFRVEADVSRYNHIPKPMRCLARGSGAVGCESANFVPVDPAMGDSAGRCVDYQEIRLQEQMARTAPAAVPREIAVVLERDLVDRVKSGDVVTVTGIVMCRWRPAVSEGRPDISVAIRASSVSAHGDQMAQRAVTGARRAEFGRFWAEHESAAMRARDTIIASMCPQIYGLFYVKLAVLLVVIGGVACTDAAGMRVRGEAHLLMVGDPGTAKSQLLRYAARLAPRAVLATGVGSTNAGLTAAAIKERGEWQLEAGALVLADRGLCCIDEFGSIRGAERNAVLEAMEQQSVSVAKAGMVCRLNARCTVLAATNSQNGSLAAGNAGLPAPLLSRFDLVLKL
ncbi:DNA helicase mcm9, partial [Coemansia sp. Cherry 401B]